MRNRARLDRLDAQLPPLAALLQWLAEAHVFGSFPAYVAWLQGQRPEFWPLVRLPRQIRRSLLARRAVTARAESEVRAAIRSTVLRFALVVELNIACVRDAVEAQPLDALLLAQAYGFLLEDELVEAVRVEAVRVDALPPAALRTRQIWREVLTDHVGRAAAVTEARRRLESRHLGGAEVLFPEVVAWQARRNAAAEAIVGLGELWLGAARKPVSRGQPERFLAGARRLGAAGAERLMTEIERDALVRAHELLGDRRAAASVAERHRRGERVPFELGP